MQLGIKVLGRLGYSNYQAHRLAKTFKRHHQKVIEELFHHYEDDEKKYLSEAKKHASELEELLLTVRELDGISAVVAIREEQQEQEGCERSLVLAEKCHRC